MVITFLLGGEEATQRFGAAFAALLQRGDLVTLSGDLGAGKSTLARAVIRALAGDETLDVPSPTFTLVQAYDDLPLPVTHADLYRIGMAEEVDELGFEQALEDGVLLVEWPQKAQGLLPPPQFAVALAHEGASRRLALRAEGEAAGRVRLLEGFS
ncbi:MAG: Chlorosome protein [Candidatus Tokpelaia hoelldobleri]|uniref:tRNA threonylcarbamoyladenosine biosynthesis protein TsaE n=1 Tax=Candidatus Tokpelaia hoelldobleri TaxID=1902579 RepID=A0A1U9JWN7_9HYPH|nr:MAG: Chlorosome protein [Candidatus Tokpelaia hoelldoblerii]